MRILTMLTLTLSLLASPLAFAEETPGEAVALQTKMDSNIENILNVVVSALVGRFPGVSKESKVLISPESALDQGKVQGTFNITINSNSSDSATEDSDESVAEATPAAPAVPILNTEGQIAVGLTRATDGGVNVDILTTGRVASADLLKAIGMLNQSITGAALLTAEEEVLPASQKASLSFDRLKQNIIAFLDQTSGSSEPTKKTQTFGAPAPMVAASGTPALDPAIAAELRTVVQDGFVISSQNGEAVFSVDMKLIKNLGAEVSKVSPAISILMSFESIEMKVGDTDATYTLTSRAQVSSQLVTTYDTYMIQEQAKEGGLTSLNELISKLGVWAVGRCTSEKYQGLCVDKLLNGCAANLRHVATCVEQARLIQDGRDSGNYVGNGALIFGQEAGLMVGDGVDATGKAINDTGAAIGSGIGNLWNMVTGNNQATTEPPPAE